MSDQPDERALLRQKLESLESLRDVLGDEAVEKAKAALEARLRAVETGGGAYIGGNVRVTGGDFIGRDKIVTPPAAPAVTVDDLLRLLAQARELLPAAGLDTPTAQVIQSDLETAEAQARQEHPNRAIVVAKLKSVAEVLGAVGGAATGLSRLLPLVQQALQWAERLF